MNIFKKLLGFDMGICETCGIVYEKREEYYKEANRWCPEHRKKYLDHQTHIKWAENHPQELKELIIKFNDEIHSLQCKIYSGGGGGGIMNQASSPKSSFEPIAAQQAAAQLNKEFGYGKGLIRDNPHIPEIFKGPSK